MKYTSFQPFNEGRPCWHCRYFDGMTEGAALCTLPNAASVRSLPQWGCSGFEREPSADDEVLRCDQSSRWQKLAGMTEHLFESAAVIAKEEKE